MQFDCSGVPGYRSVRTRTVFCALVSGVALASVFCLAAVELGFSTTVTPGLITNLINRFGDSAKLRIGAWTDFVHKQRGTKAQGSLPGPESAPLTSVNAFVNTVPFFEDQKHWGRLDYWATPAETYGSHGGDCEDFAIAKYFLLKELGVPVERLRITYVRAIKLNQPHMVLAYYASPGSEPLILDNLEGGIRPASERTDLVPVFSFNDEDVVIIQGNRKGSSSQIRAWQGLIDRLERESTL